MAKLSSKVERMPATVYYFFNLGQGIRKRYVEDIIFNKYEQKALDIYWQSYGSLDYHMSDIEKKIWLSNMLNRMICDDLSDDLDYVRDNIRYYDITYDEFDLIEDICWKGINSEEFTKIIKSYVNKSYIKFFL